MAIDRMENGNFVLGQRHVVVIKRREQKQYMKYEIFHKIPSYSVFVCKRVQECECVWSTFITLHRCARYASNRTIWTTILVLCYRNGLWMSGATPKNDDFVIVGSRSHVSRCHHHHRRPLPPLLPHQIGALFARCHRKSFCSRRNVRMVYIYSVHRLASACRVYLPAAHTHRAYAHCAKMFSKRFNYICEHRASWHKIMDRVHRDKFTSLYLIKECAVWVCVCARSCREKHKSVSVIRTHHRHARSPIGKAHINWMPNADNNMSNGIHHRALTCTPLCVHCSYMVDASVGAPYPELINTPLTENVQIIMTKRERNAECVMDTYSHSDTYIKCIP